MIVPKAAYPDKWHYPNEVVEMDSYVVIKIGGFYQIAFLIFHAMFWKIFKWRLELPRLTPINGAIMQVLNLCLMFCFLVFGYVSLFHTSELISTGLGPSLLLFMGLIALSVFIFPPEKGLGLFISSDIILTVLLFIVCWKKGEPLKW
jgi:hypothetical protein